MYSFNQIQVDTVFHELGLPLIEKGIDEIEADREHLIDWHTHDVHDPHDYKKEYEVIVSNGTGKSVLKAINAELERRPR